MIQSRKRQRAEWEYEQFTSNIPENPDSTACNGTPWIYFSYSPQIMNRNFFTDWSNTKHPRRERDTEIYHPSGPQTYEHFPSFLEPISTYYVPPSYHYETRSPYSYRNVDWIENRNSFWFEYPPHHGTRSRRNECRWHYRPSQERKEYRHERAWNYCHVNSRGRSSPQRDDHGPDSKRRYISSRENRSRHRSRPRLTRHRSQKRRRGDSDHNYQHYSHYQHYRHYQRVPLRQHRREKEQRRSHKRNNRCRKSQSSPASSDSTKSSYRSTSVDTTNTTEHDPYSAFHDKHGHYIVTLGENLTSRWKVLSVIGEGTFGKVLECWDRQTHQYVAIKVIRAVEKYRDAARIEADILRRINRHDPDTHYGCVKLTDSFEFRGHVCLVFPKYGLSLYDYIRFNDYQPLPLDLIRQIGSELFRSVAFLHSIKLVHTDLKPENILFRDPAYRPNEQTRCSDSVNNTNSFPGIVIIDFGSATFEDQHHTRIVCTRHYRAPEVLLDRGWSYPLDIWSIGCILIELYTGEPLFQTHHNQEHLDMMQHILGPFPPYFLEGSPYRDNLHSLSPKITKLRPLRELVPPTSPILNAFYDLLCRTLEYDPRKRITAHGALKHPFFTLPPESSSFVNSVSSTTMLTSSVTSSHNPILFSTSSGSVSNLITLTPTPTSTPTNQPTEEFSIGGSAGATQNV